MLVKVCHALSALMIKLVILCKPQSYMDLHGIVG